jgi:hypothetical protein
MTVKKKASTKKASTKKASGKQNSQATQDVNKVTEVQQLKAKLQEANMIIEAITEQRNTAQNQIVQLQVANRNLAAVAEHYKKLVESQ